MIVELTSHSVQRAKERLNISKKSLQRTAQKAFEDGIHHDHCQGKLKHWATSRVFDNVNHVRILGNQAYLFFDNLLVTVLIVPKFYLPKSKIGGRYEIEEEEFSIN